MKVTLEKDYRKYYTLEDLDKAKRIIEYEKKEDEMPIKDWAEYAAREALKGTGDYFAECLKAEAHTARNCRANDSFWASDYDDNGVWEDGSGDMDVWLEATVRTDKGFLVFGAYLSDIWQTGAVEYKQHMYIRYFKEAEL